MLGRSKHMIDGVLLREDGRRIETQLRVLGEVAVAEKVRDVGLPKAYYLTEEHEAEVHKPFNWRRLLYIVAGWGLVIGYIGYIIQLLPGIPPIYYLLFNGALFASPLVLLVAWVVSKGSIRHVVFAWYNDPQPIPVIPEFEETPEGPQLVWDDEEARNNQAKTYYQSVMSAFQDGAVPPHMLSSLPGALKVLILGEGVLAAVLISAIALRSFN